MKNYDKLQDAIYSLKPTIPVFHITLSHSKSHVNLNESKINREKDFGDILSTEALLYNLCLNYFTEQFNAIDLKYDVKYDAIFNDCLLKIKCDLKDLYKKISPNVAPKMTMAYKVINKFTYEDLPNELNDLIISIWLYYKQYDSNEKVTKNLYGLLCLMAEKLKEYKAIK